VESVNFEYVAFNESGRDARGPSKPLSKSYHDLSLPFAVSVIQGQETKQPLTREQLIAAARETMLAARYCALITLHSAGHPQARTLDPFPPDEHLVVWLGTNPRTRKVAEIRRNPRVTLHYFDREAQAYVTISGIARLVNDPKEKAKHWKDEWKDFYPDRVNGYLLIAVTPLRMEVVNVKKGIVGDPKTWRPPDVSFARKAKS
jgi:general stress protein 26